MFEALTAVSAMMMAQTMSLIMSGLHTSCARTLRLTSRVCVHAGTLLSMGHLCGQAVCEETEWVRRANA